MGQSNIIDLINKKDLIIFDVDMTLFDTTQGMKLCYQKAFEKIGASFEENNLQQYCKESLKSTFNSIENKNKKAKFSDFEKAFIDTSKKSMADMSLMYPDVVQTLSLLKSAGKKMAVVTGKTKDAVIKMFQKNDILDYFAVIISYEDTSEEKPNPDGLIKCLDKLNINDKNRVIYIGDAYNDYCAAKNCGIDCAIKNPSFKCENEIKNLSDLTFEIYSYINYVISTKYNFFDLKDPDTKLKQWIENNKLELLESTNLSQKDVSFDNSFKIHIFNRNSIVVTQKYKNDDLLNFKTIIKEKESLIDDSRNNKNNELNKLLSTYNEIFENNKSNLKVSNKVQYGVVAYRILLIGEEKTKELFENINKNFIFSLLLKKQILPIAKNRKSPENSDVKILNLNDCNSFYSIWGARMMISSKQNEKSKLFWSEYLISEARTQNAWQLLTNESKKLDSIHKLKRKNLSPLINDAYDVLLSEADFNFINSSISHKSELDILKNLLEVSNLQQVSQYLKEKILLLERRIKTKSEEQDNKNSNLLNILLFVLALVSAFSAVLQLAQIFLDNTYNKTIAISYIIIALASLFLFMLISKIRRK